MVAANKYRYLRIDNDAKNQVPKLDELCSAMAWSANTEAIFALEKIDLPLVDTFIALEAAGGDILFLVSTLYKGRNQIFAEIGSRVMVYLVTNRRRK